MFELKVNEEDVNRYVSDAILKSALGKELEKSVNKALQDALSGYNSPVAKLCSEAMTNEIKRILATEYWQNYLKESLARQLTEAHLKKVVDAAVSKSIEYFKEDRY